MTFGVGDIVYFSYDDLHGKGMVVVTDNFDGNSMLVRLLGSLEGKGHSGDGREGEYCHNFWWVNKRFARKTDNRNYGGGYYGIL